MTLYLGSKKYLRFNHSPLSNFFSSIVRFNLALPGPQFGYCFGSLHLNNHLYDATIRGGCSVEEFLKQYSDYASQEFLAYYYNFLKENIHKYRHVLHMPPRVEKYNQFLRVNNCPIQFEKRPRTGIVSIMEALLLEKQDILLSGFTINPRETYQSAYWIQAKVANENLHSTCIEAEILSWLHQNNFIDATFCLLEDEFYPKITQPKNVKVSSYCQNILASLYGGISYSAI